jgi:hypothetical protein
MGLAKYKAEVQQKDNEEDAEFWYVTLRTVAVCCLSLPHFFYPEDTSSRLL